MSKMGAVNDSLPAATDAPRAPHPKQGTVGWLAEQIWKAPSRVPELLEPHILPTERDIYRHYEDGAGRPVLRKDLKAGDHSIHYLDYSPPAMWATAYSVLRVKVQPRRQESFMYHSGEEILTPIRGAIRYRFMDAVDGGPPRPTEVIVRENEAIKINCQLPHHAESAVDSDSDCWMILRYVNDSAREIYTPSDLERKPETSPRLVSAEKLVSPTVYALVAWGLAEALRVARLRAGLTIHDVARACDVDTGLLARVETVGHTRTKRRSSSADAPAERSPSLNLSLHSLVRLAEYLRIPLAQLISSASWRFDTPLASLPSEDAGETEKKDAPAAFAAKSLFAPSDHSPHQLHTTSLEFGQNHQRTIDVRAGLSKDVPSSWIVRHGDLMLTLKSRTDSRRIALRKGSVLHFRDVQQIEVLALSAASVLQVVHSTECHCEPPEARTA